MALSFLHLISPRKVGQMVVVALAFLLTSGLPAAEQRPNIVFVLADDMGPGDLSCYGGTIAPTPAIDRLAKEGTRFTQYYAAAPICSPSRAGLITGMFPARWKITSFLQTRAGNRGCEQADFLTPEAPSLPRILQGAGYATAHFGKWHLGGGRDVVNPPKFAPYGYDEHAGTWESPEPHPDITATNWIWSPQDQVKRWDRTAFFVDQTLDFLRRKEAQPCFINVWLDDVHTPWVPGEDAPKGDVRENLRRVLIETDRQIGRLLEGIRALPKGRETLVIFTSDNGAAPTFGGERSAGLRGGKSSLYEGGIRMPFIAWWPDRVPAGRVDTVSVIAAVDMLPTLSAIAHARVPAEARLDGVDVSAALLGTPQTRTTPLFWEYGRNDASFKFPKGRDRSPNVAMRDGPWKALVNADGSGAQLFNLESDRGETKNVAGEHPEIAKRLVEQALAWRTSLP